MTKPEALTSHIDIQSQNGIHKLAQNIKTIGPISHSQGSFELTKSGKGSTAVTSLRCMDLDSS